MLRNLTTVDGSGELTVLNEVLSLNAQELGASSVLEVDLNPQ